MRRSTCLLSGLFVLVMCGTLTSAESQAERPVYRPPVSEGEIAQLDLNKLTGRLIATLQQMHVETDPQDPQFGLIYETFDPERKLWVEGEGRDTMHHMMWTMVGLANAYRASGDPQVLKFLNDYPYSFYLRMMLHGEQYFGKEYGNGYCPYYWDDGDAVEILAYFRGQFGDDVRVRGFSPMSSVHLAQDLALGHLDLWWLTGDPRLKQATNDLYHQVHYGKIAERFAARNFALIDLKAHPAKDLKKFREAEAQGKEMLLKLTEADRRKLYEKQFGANYGPIITSAQNVINPEAKLPPAITTPHKPTDNIAWLRLRERKSGSIPAFPDDESFSYYQTLAAAGDAPTIPEPFARWFTMNFLTRPLMNEYWSDDVPYRHGYIHFPGANEIWQMNDGKFATYHSQAKWHVWHTRSLHYAWLSAIALQMMAERPEMHEAYRREIAEHDPVIRFHDRTPTLDGRRDAGYADVFALAGAKVSLASDPLSLFVLIAPEKSEELRVTIHGTEKVGEHRATVQVAKDGTIGVVNQAGEALLFWSQAGSDGIEVQIPYMIHRPQHDWLTAVEHGRHRIDLRIGGADAEPATETVYFLSDAQRIQDRLQKTVEGAIVNHAQLFDEQGWLPYNLADKSKSDFSRLSFSGAYGHLIHAIAQYQLWQQGKRDWQVKRQVYAAPQP